MSVETVNEREIELQKKIDQLQAEKADLYLVVDAEEEAMTNKLTRQLFDLKSTLSAVKTKLLDIVDENTSNSLAIKEVIDLIESKLTD